MASMTALIEFEAAARLQSFTEAGAELGVTQAAVSRQVHLLEETLGVSLFVRLHRGIRLTTAGEFLYKEVSGSLKRMATAYDHISTGSQPADVVLSTTSAFAHFRVLPRLSTLTQASPQLKLRLTTETYLADLRKDQIDLAVRYGNGTWRDGISTLLFDEEVFPVCSPALLESGKAPSAVECLSNVPLITYDSPSEGWISWEDWFTAVGVRPSKISYGIHCSFYIDAIRAAMHGHGAVLGWKRLLHDLLETQELVRVTREAFKTRDAYFVVVPNGRQLTPNLECLIRWLRADCALHPA